MDDVISRQSAIEGLADEVVGGLEKIKAGYGNDWLGGMHTAWRVLDDLPSAQPDGIPLEWIDKHLEWLDNCDNDFAQLAKVGIRAMVEIWKKDKT